MHEEIPREQYEGMLKALYHEERKKLEAMWIYKQEAKLRFLRAKKDMIERAEERVSTLELLGRNDISETAKFNILHNSEKAGPMEDKIAKIFEEERAAIDQQENAEAQSTSYHPLDFGEYIVQMQKVAVLDQILSENGLMADQAYEEIEGAKNEK